MLPRVAWQQLAEFEAVMRKACSLCFYSQSDRPETSAKMALRLAMVDAMCQEEKMFHVVNLNAVKWSANMSFKDTPAVKMTTNSSLDTMMQPMSNESVELARSLVDSYEECFSKPNLDRLVAMCAHPLFA